MRSSDDGDGTHKHDVNNALAALLVNLDFVAQTLGECPAEAPFMTDASAEQRQDILTALTLSVRSCRRLAELLRVEEEGTS